MPGFLKLILCGLSVCVLRVCVYVCVCVCCVCMCVCVYVCVSAKLLISIGVMCRDIDPI